MFIRRPRQLTFVSNNPVDIYSFTTQCLFITKTHVLVTSQIWT